MRDPVRSAAGHAFERGLRFKGVERRRSGEISRMVNRRVPALRGSQVGVRSLREQVVDDRHAFAAGGKGRGRYRSISADPGSGDEGIYDIDDKGFLISLLMRLDTYAS